MLASAATRPGTRRPWSRARLVVAVDQFETFLLRRGAALALLVLAACRPVMPSAPSPAGQRSAAGLWYTVRGTGSPVLLLHGANLDGRSLEGLAQRLAPHHRVIVMDLRFHGRSLDGAGPMSWIDDVADVLDAVGVPRALLVGHSLGAQIATDFALERPGRVEGLVLIGPALSGYVATARPAGIEAVIAAVRANDTVAQGRALAAMPTFHLVRDTAGQREINAIVAENTRLFRVDRSRVTTRLPPATGRLEALRVPTLMVVGDADPTEAMAVAHLLRSRAPDARLVVVSRCGHLAPTDCPDEVASAVLSLLRDRR